MTIKIMALGDVVGAAGLAHLEQHLWSLRSRYQPDLVIVNGENASDVRGLSCADAQAILDAGADLITLGNHSFRIKDLHSYLESGAAIIRPANYPPEAPGEGCRIMDAAGWRVLCVNLQGVVYLDPLTPPIETLEQLLCRYEGKYDIAVVDLHAEATSEKGAVARKFDGRVAALFGTHTHVPTADEQILPGGTGFVTDLGMVGPINSILGCEIDNVLERFATDAPIRMRAAAGPCVGTGVLFEIDPEAGRTTAVTRLRF